MKKVQPAIVLCFALLVVVCYGQPPRLKRELSRVPPPVRKAIRAHLEGGKLSDLEEDNEDGVVIYDVEIVRDGKERGFTLDAKGELLDEEVFLDELPPAVQQSVKRHVGTATLGEIDKSAGDDDISYDVEMTRGVKERSFTLDADGELTSEEVFLNELPRPVQLTIQKQVGAATLGEIDKSMEDGEAFYDVEMTAGGKTHTFSVGAKGELLDIEISMTELPAAVQAAIQKEAGAGKPDEIEKCFDGDEVSYDVEITSNDKSRTLSFDPDGTLFSTEEDVALSDTPDAVQQQIKTLVVGGKLLGISKTTEDNEVSYDVGVKNGEGEKTVSLDPDGKIIPDENQ